MASQTRTDSEGTVFRVDKFVVPGQVEHEFLTRLQQIHAFVKQQSGCLKTRILKQVAGEGAFNVVAYIEWADAASVERAVASVQAWFAEEKFDPKAFTWDLGIKADQGVYQCYSENIQLLE